MADLVDQLVPYEILVRFGDDGEPKGAHVCYRRIVKLGDEVLKDEPLPAAPLTLDGFPTSGLMSDVTRDALARVTSLEAEMEERGQAMSALQSEMTTASHTIANLQAALDAATARATTPPQQQGGDE